MMANEAIPELTLTEAWELLSEDQASVLIDVRTQAEWTFVGVPVLDQVGKQVQLVEWNQYPSGSPNPSFIDEATSGIDPQQTVLLLCRSGARSAAAANALREVGYANVYNVVAGFEGDLNASGHRQDGWRYHLPWRQG